MYDLFLAFMILVYVAYVISQIAQGKMVNDFSMQNYGNLFVIGAIVSTVMFVFKVHKKEIVDRVELGLIVWLFIGAIAFLGNISSVLYYYDTYTRVIPFISIFVIGFLTTAYMPSGFIGVLSSDKNAGQIASLKLLIVVILAGLWALYSKQYWDNSFIYFVVPLMIVRWLYDRWGKQLRGEKVFLFKW